MTQNSRFNISSFTLHRANSISLFDKRRIDFFIIFVYSLFNTHDLVDFSVRPASTLTNE